MENDEASVEDGGWRWPVTGEWQRWEEGDR